MTEVLELGADGWLRGGRLWTPLGPFYGVIGDPVGHSLSPRLQQTALAERELDLEYLPLRIGPGQLRTLKMGECGRLLAGFNVTAPHKEAVARLCDGRTEQARALGVVNTVKVEEGRWLGHNTDVGGVSTVLAQAWGGEAPPERGIVLGTGGSARAAAAALARWGVPEIRIQGRLGEGRRSFAAWAGEQVPGAVVETLPGENPPPPDRPTVFVSCLAGRVENRPFLPDAAGPERSFLLDLRYGEQLGESAPPLGFGFADGLPVLMMQGGLSFAWWFGPPVPWQAMQDALC